METYDPILVGYGMDQWFINVIGVHRRLLLSMTLRVLTLILFKTKSTGN